MMEGKEFSQLQGNFVKLSLYFAVGIFAISCAKVEKPVETRDSEPAPTPEISEFDAELRAFRTANFDYIFVIRRKDNNPMDAEDKMFVRNNSHFATNRFTLTKDEKVIFAGSNYKFNKDGLAALKERFEVSDFSKTEDEIVKRKEKLKEKRKRKERKAKASMPRKAERITE